jgi:hypothetical protein
MAVPAAAAKSASKPGRVPLAQVRRERIEAPWTLLMYGMPGLGKTTFASQLPDPIFICAEKRGADEVEVARYPEAISGFEDMREAIRRLAVEEHSFRSVVIDTIDDLEPLIWADVIRRDGKATHIEDVGGGFHKGYIAAVDYWRILAADLERMQQLRGMHVALISHAARRNWKNPEGENYDRWEPAVNQRAAGFLIGWVKAVLFAQEEIGLKRLDPGKQAKAKAISIGKRIIRTTYTPAYDAKNRWSLPDPLPLNYADFEAAYQQWRSACWNAGVMRELVARRLADFKQINPERGAKAEAFFASAGDDPGKLKSLLELLEAAIAEEAAAQSPTAERSNANG